MIFHFPDFPLFHKGMVLEALSVARCNTQGNDKKKKV